MKFLENLKKKYGTQSTYVDDNTLETIRGERENRAEAADRARRVKLAEEALEQARIDKQRWIDSFFGGSSGRADPNADLASFVQRIIGGGVSGNDASKMVIQVEAKDVVESSSGNTNQEKPPSTRFRFFTKPKPMETTMAALNKPENKGNLDKLPRKK